MDASRGERVTEFDEVIGMVRGGRIRAWLAVNVAMIEMDAALQGGWSAQELEARVNAGSPRRRRARPTK